MPSTQSLSRCFYAASAVIALVLALASGSWVLGGPLGLVLGVAVGFLPAMLIVVLGFPITGPVLLLAACCLERKQDRQRVGRPKEDGPVRGRRTVTTLCSRR